VIEVRGDYRNRAGLSKSLFLSRFALSSLFVKLAVASDFPKAIESKQPNRREKIMQTLFSKCARFGKFALLVVAMAVVVGAFHAADAQTKRRSTRAIKSAPATRKVTRIPVGTQMKIRLEDTIDTKESKDGDRFNATVITPSRYADATVEGHVAKINKSGKMTGKTELALAFDRIKLSNGQIVPMAAQVVRVYGENSAKEVDEEGNVRSGSKGKTTAVRTGGGAAAGAVIGAIAGGGKGAAIGAAVGAAAGAGSTYIQGSNKVKLESGTEILIKTTH
jgi:hypothetical protein